ncbi:MAG: protein-L-isoaspartate O-methyltransferase [Gammaproteobacteria bacterium]|nr:protein-L-isoaspartate O-methyltransferase [Gammaproteobacteria bacterium]NNF50573.1 protein-L-isoaspartate O-methyltransferase [Woeseiaceae bacterium]MBT8094644.1 protein-L-isoaspartate O-methyltransferase [Gammaproteobacteria bacterium]MBT8106408.1 protein-L-isoaspartate O-methyltransferase [Gammaproteobacteria bacterium]NNK26423.1 protein-L-isoaspartate O-methyltransferase [Woeseiaceae bacterium]
MNTDYARLQMVMQQVRGWNVYDEDVLAMLMELPREHFVPAGYEPLAFADVAIPLGHGEHMMTPTLEGRLLQALGLRSDDRVLEIGTGSGFMTACLARLARHVTSLDIYPDFIKDAERKLEQEGIDNVELIEMDATRELPEGRFDAIAVTGSIQAFDPRFVEALDAQGRLFIVVGDAPAMEAKLIERTNAHDWNTVALFETDLQPLVHGALPPQFTF